MGISQYIKEIGRGPRGARVRSPAPRRQICWARCSTVGVTDLEIGAFCLAMRIKGETAPEEMVGFLDATHQRLARLPASDKPAGRAAQLQRRAQAAGADAAAGAVAGARRACPCCCTAWRTEATAGFWHPMCL
jgi:hypothetical protein